jgi:glycosyltransferase involved in cell wall biosynthesis
MRVAHITMHYLPIVGGQEVYIKNLINLLKENGIYSDIYQPINKNYHYFTKNKHKNVKLVFNLPFIGRIIPNINKYLFNFFLIFHFFSFFKYDKIIIHYAFHSLPFWFLKKKVIILSHGVEWYLENNRLYDRISHFIAKITFNRFTIVANDTHYFRVLGVSIKPKEKYFKEVSTNKLFIPNCVDINYFKPSKPLLDLMNKNIILVPRQITWDRGIHLAIESFYLFNMQVKDFIMLISGEIRSIDYKKFCDELIKKYRLEDKVIWKHKVINEQMVQYYSSSKVTLIPTIRREGTSLSALESMACGCPVVSTNVAGLLDLPTVQAHPNAESLCVKLLELFKNYDQIKQEQFEFTRKVFNMENWKEAWLKVIKNY